MKTEKLIRPYSGKLNLQPRRAKFLDDSIKYHQKMTGFFYQLLQAVGGATTHQNINDFINNETVDEYQAILLFQVVDKNATTPECPQNQLLERFAQYTNKQPTENVQHYLSSRIDTKKYRWQDNHILAQNITSKLNISNSQFQEIVHAILSNNLYIKDKAPIAATSFISQIYGTGKKAPKAARLDILFQTNQTLPKAPLPTTYGQLQQIITQACGESTAQAILTKFGNTGRTTSIQIALTTNPNTTLDQKKFENLLRKFAEDEVKYRNKVDIPHSTQLRNFILNESNQFCKWHTKPAIEALKCAIADIQSKTSNNLRVMQEKNELYKSFRMVDPHVQIAVNALQNHMNTLEEPYAPYPHSFGSIKDFYEDLNNNVPTDEAINNLIYDSDNFSRRPDPNWLRIIVPMHLTHSSSQILAAVKYLSNKQAYEYRKPFPFTATNLPATYGKYNITGTINPPAESLHGKLNGNHSNMWLTALLLDERDWKKHHLCFASSRYFEEVYFTDPSLPTTDKLRNPKFGFTLKSQLGDEAKDRIHNSPKQRQKAVKTIERIKANSTHNVTWNPETSFQLQKRGDKFLISINHRIEMKKIPGQNKTNDGFVINPKDLFSILKEGDRIISQDLNQTAATYCAVYEVAKPALNTFNHYGIHLKLIATEELKMSLKTKKAIIPDALSYQGVHIHDKENGFIKLKDACKSFITPRLNPNQKRAWDNSVSKKENLYPFITAYMRLLTKVMKDHRQDLNLFRTHLDHILFKHHLSPLKLHGLSMIGLDSSRATKSVINSYFSLQNAKTDQEKKDKDRPLHEASKNLIDNQTCRRKERVRLETSLTMRLVHKHNAKAIIIEGELPHANTETSQYQNNVRLDWSAKNSAKLKTESANCAGIAICQINPCYTSHQNPFRHNSKDPDLRPRFEQVIKGKMAMYQLNILQRILKVRNKSSTNIYYRQAVLNFCSHHNLTEKDITSAKFPSDLERKIQDDTYLIPKKGGRIYISSLPVTSCARPCTSNHYFGKGQYECNADAVAAVNIMLKVKP